MSTPEKAEKACTSAMETFKRIIYGMFRQKYTMPFFLLIAASFMLIASIKLDYYTQNNSDEQKNTKTIIEGTQCIAGILLVVLVFKMIKWIPKVDCHINTWLAKLINTTEICQYSHF